MAEAWRPGFVAGGKHGRLASISRVRGRLRIAVVLSVRFGLGSGAWLQALDRLLLGA